MTKNDIIKYVMDTPENTNPSVLSSMLEEMLLDAEGSSIPEIELGVLDTISSGGLSFSLTNEQAAIVKKQYAEGSLFKLMFTYNNKSYQVYISTYGYNEAYGLSYYDYDQEYGTLVVMMIDLNDGTGTIHRVSFNSAEYPWS